MEFNKQYETQGELIKDKIDLGKLTDVELNELYHCAIGEVEDLVEREMESRYEKGFTM